MAYAKTSLRKEKRDLREQMRSMGLSYREIAAEFARRYKLRPRAAWREAYGWSLQDTADRINDYRGSTGLDPGGFAGMTASHLSEYERWPGHAPTPSGRRPTPYLLAVLAAAYDCTLTDLVDLADRQHMPPPDLLILDKHTSPAGQFADPSLQHAAPSIQSAPEAKPHGVSEQKTLTSDGGLKAGGRVTRTPTLFNWGHEAGLRTALESATVAGMEEPVAPELATYFRDQLAGHYKADMFLGPRHLIPSIEPQARLIGRLASVAAVPVRRELLDTAAAYGALLGWLYQDAGDLAASSLWRDTTLSLAHRAGDPQLISYALTNKAMLALDQGEGRVVIEYAQAARANERHLCAKARVLALQHEAHGHAMTGDRAAADRLLDTAATLTGQVDDEFPWGNACHRTPHYMEVQRATCYGHAGSQRDSADAAVLWDEILGAMPESARRDNAVFTARQASALAVIPEPERVAEIAATAADAVQATGSARLRRELLLLPSRASGWATSAAGRRLHDVVASVA